MAFAQLTYRESLRDIQACLRGNQHKLYYIYILGKVSRNTLAHANQMWDWRIYGDFAQILISRAKQFYLNEPFGVELNHTPYALDSAIIDLCLSLFPWVIFRKRKEAVKLHTLLDLRGSIPTVVLITYGKIHNVNILDQITIKLGALYIIDRGYLDFSRLHTIHQKAGYFVIRAKVSPGFTSHVSTKRCGFNAIRLSCRQPSMHERIILRNPDESDITT